LVGVRADDSGFVEAFDGLHDRARRLALRVLGDPTRAEDVASEAMVRAYVHWRRVSRLAWRDGWVLRTAANLAIDATRPDRGDPNLSAAVTGDATDAVALRAALVAALRSLPRRQREAVCLRYLTDLPEADVAKALGVSAGTVKTHLHRGLAALRDRLGEPEEDIVAHLT
jgi:RNA polymerase sigma-70 factor (sigma-E family)